jgi:polyferredoxin
MLASTPENALRGVRALLLLGWLALLISLFWDPVTPWFTHPSNEASPFRVDGSSVVIQGEAITSEPYAMGNRIFWSMIVPLVPLFLLVAGHEAWRRICPLSFVSQLPRLFGIQRKRRKLNRRTGVVEGAVVLPTRQGWWQRHALDVQLALLFIGLNARILFVNSDRTALAVFIIGILAIVLLVGWLWGGKTWCNYLCPLGTVQKVYTGPGGLLESRPHIAKPATPQSMCRKPGPDGDSSNCVGCTPACPDIDRERSYWESLEAPSVRRLYYGLFGLLIGFYGFYYLYSGTWDYYYSGLWTHEPGQLSKLLGPGLYLNQQTVPIPKLISAPLVIGLAVGLSYALWSLIERAWTAVSRRWSPHQSATESLHQVLTVCAFVSINTFYLFAGRGNLALLPAPVVRGVDIVIVLLTSLWLVRTLRRHPLTYRQESLSASLRTQLERLDIDFPRLLDGRTLKDLKPGEIYVLARTLPEFTQTQRLQAYRSVIEDLIRTHRMDQTSSQELLREMREAVGITDAEHREIMLGFGITDSDSSQIEQSAVFENWLRRDNYRVACEALLLGRLRPGMRLSAVIAEQELEQPMQSLIDLYQITPSEHQQALVEISSRAGLLYERALRELDRLGDDAALAFALNIETLAHPEPHLQGLTRLLLHEQIAESRPAITRVLTTLVALGPGPDTDGLARQLRTLVGGQIDTVIEDAVESNRSETWTAVLPAATTRILQGELDVEARPDSAGLIPYPELVTQGPQLTERLEALITDGSRRAALALWILAALAPKTAQQYAGPKDGDSDWMQAVRRQVAQQTTDAKAEMADGMTLPAPIEVAINLSRCRLFADLRLASLAELAQMAIATTRTIGEIVFRAEERVEALLLLHTGECRTEPSGQRFDAEVEVAAFGIQALLYPCAYGQELRVESDTAAFIVLPREELSAWLRREPVAAAAVFASLANLAAEQTSDAARFAEEDRI